MARYEPDHEGIGALLVSSQMGDVMRAIAQSQALPLARSLSPDAAPYGSGYVDSFKVEVETIMWAGSPRKVANLVNASDYAAAVEWGWDVAHRQFGNHKGYHVLQTVADVIGSK